MSKTRILRKFPSMPRKSEYWTRKNRRLKKIALEAAANPADPKHLIAKTIRPEALLGKPSDLPDPELAKIGDVQKPKPIGRPPGSKDTVPRFRPSQVNKEPDFSDLHDEEEAPELAPQPDPMNRPPSDPPPPPPGAQPYREPGPNYRLAAERYFDMFHNLAAAGFQDPAWHPRDNNEREFVVEPLQKYLESQGAQDLPPGWALVVAIGLYSLARTQSPPTKAKLGMVISKITGRQARASSAPGFQHTAPQPAPPSPAPAPDPVKPASPAPDPEPSQEPEQSTIRVL